MATLLRKEVPVLPTLPSSASARMRVNQDAREKRMTIRWGIIGLGDIAERNFVPALVKAADGQLVSVFSRSVDKGNAFIAN